MDNAATAIDRAEAALREMAREQTKLSFAHRKAAERLHRAADELRKTLSPLGIDVKLGTESRKES